MRPRQPLLRPDERSALRRFGYLVAAFVNGLLLWVSHQLLDWGWPAFLTEEFEQVLGVITLSFVASIGVNLIRVGDDRGRVYAATELVTAAFGVVVGVRVWEVFPFDFRAYATDWTWLVRWVLIVAIVGSAIAVIVNLVRLVTGHDPRGAPS
jgi:hypothetical protein